MTLNLKRPYTKLNPTTKQSTSTVLSRVANFPGGEAEGGREGAYCEDGVLKPWGEKEKTRRQGAPPATATAVDDEAAHFLTEGDSVHTCVRGLLSTVCELF